MNYYEYAPPFFRWLFGNTNIKPWEFLPYLMWGTVILAFIFVILALVPFFRKKQFKGQKWIQLGCLMSGVILFYYGIQWDKYYLDYEFDNALSQPGIFINKQVEADGYAEISLYYTSLIGAGYRDKDKDRDRDKEEVRFKPAELIKIKEIPASTLTNQWVLKDDKSCYRSDLYLYKEKATILKKNDEIFVYNKPSNEVSEYTGYKDGQCVEGTLNKPISRYYYIKESDRVGLGLRREKHYIVDTYTGEELGYQYRFRTARSLLYSMTLGLLDDFMPYGNNQTIQSPEGVVIKKYYSKEVYDDYRSMPEYFIIQTLIPSKFFNATTQGGE